MNYLGKLRFFIELDDYMGVFHTHLVAGAVGGFLVGIFATKEGCAAFALLTPGGAVSFRSAFQSLHISGRARIEKNTDCFSALNTDRRQRSTNRLATCRLNLHYWLERCLDVTDHDVHQICVPRASTYD